MTEPASNKPRTWRPMAAWSVAVVAALGLLFVAAITYAKYREVDRVLGRTFRKHFSPSMAKEAPLKTSEAVALLGGPKQAAGKLGWYLRLPYHVKDVDELGMDIVYMKKCTATILLAFCGPAGERQLVLVLQSNNLPMRMSALQAFRQLQEVSPDGLSALQDALNDKSEEVRTLAAEALKKIRGEETGK